MNAMNESRPHLPLLVHRVASIDEVQALEASGVEYIGFHVDEEARWGLDPHPFWTDNRYLCVDELGELLGAVRKARPVLACSEGLIDAVRPLMSRFAEPPLHYLNAYALPDEAWIAALAQTGAQFIYGYRDIAPGDAAPFPGLARAAWPHLFAVDLQVFPSEQDAWGLLSAPPTEQADEIVRQADVEQLARSLPLFLSLNTHEGNAADIAAQFAGWPLKGLSFTLSPTSYGSFHTHEFKQVQRAIACLRGA
jgi:hypothetical protein